MVAKHPMHQVNTQKIRDRMQKLEQAERDELAKLIDRLAAGQSQPTNTGHSQGFFWRIAISTQAVARKLSNRQLTAHIHALTQAIEALRQARLDLEGRQLHQARAQLLKADRHYLYLIGINHPHAYDTWRKIRLWAGHLS